MLVHRCDRCCVYKKEIQPCRTKYRGIWAILMPQFGNRCTRLTMSTAMNPIVTEVNPKEGQPPCPGRVPGQLNYAVVIPEVDIRGELQPSDKKSMKKKIKTNNCRANKLVPFHMSLLPQKNHKHSLHFQLYAISMTPKAF